MVNREGQMDKEKLRCAVWVFVRQLTNKTGQKGQNATKTSQHKVVYNALKHSQGSYRWGGVILTKRSWDMAVWEFGGMIGKQNNAEGPNFNQNDPPQSHLQCIKILTRLIQMMNGEEMGVKRTNRSWDVTVWVFGGWLTNKTVQKGQISTKMQPKTSHLKSVHNAWK